MKKTLSAVLACLLLFAAVGLAGCADRPQREEALEETNPNVVTLYDFEDYLTGVEPLILLNYFGTVSLNTDAQYVRHGSGSLKMVPEGCLFIMTYSCNNVRSRIVIFRKKQNFLNTKQTISPNQKMIKS